MQMRTLIEEVRESGTRILVVTGGVCSSIGKGVLISSMGALLKASGYSVSVIKCDPYLNVDPGTMSPHEHGEVFVTQDGAETDLDLGHYERMLNTNLTKLSSITAGKVYQAILDKERKGKYLGKCVQVVPHVVGEIKERILTAARDLGNDFLLLEIGGTVGDIEGEIFLEAVRQIRTELGEGQLLHGHLSLVPYLSWANETKKKPTQHSVMLLRKVGLTPDMLFLRTEKNVSVKDRQKLAVACNVSEDSVFQVLSYNPMYKLFADLDKQGLTNRMQQLARTRKIVPADLGEWKELLQRIARADKPVKIGLIAKYVGDNDPYISVIEAIKSAGFAMNRKAEIVTVNAEKLESNENYRDEMLSSIDGMVVPGGFGERGVNGKIIAAKWAREKKVPYLGLCLGMQAMLIESARNLCGLTGASSSEIDKNTEHPIISLIEEQKYVKMVGGSMRLGAYPCALEKNSRARELYGEDEVLERHRHRYEFNNDYKKQLEDVGVLFSGIYKKGDLVEIAELPDHPFMIGAQSHPEFLSTPLKPHPLFLGLLRAVVKK